MIWTLEDIIVRGVSILALGQFIVGKFTGISNSTTHRHLKTFKILEILIFCCVKNFLSWIVGVNFPTMNFPDAIHIFKNEYCVDMSAIKLNPLILFLKIQISYKEKEIRNVYISWFYDSATAM